MNRLTKLAIAIFVVALRGLATSAFASIDANIDNDGLDYVGRIIVITDPRASSGIRCGEPVNLYKAVIIHPGGGRAMITTMAFHPEVIILAGDRFDITAQGTCDDQHVLTLSPK